MVFLLFVAWISGINWRVVVHSCAIFRRGKLRGGKISAVQTDFSAVLDFLDQSTWLTTSTSVLAAHSEDLHKDVFGLADHPGPPLYSDFCSAPLHARSL